MHASNVQASREAQGMAEANAYQLQLQVQSMTAELQAARAAAALVAEDKAALHRALAGVADAQDTRFATLVRQLSWKCHSTLHT